MAQKLVLLLESEATALHLRRGRDRGKSQLRGKRGRTVSMGEGQLITAHSVICLFVDRVGERGRGAQGEEEEEGERETGREKERKRERESMTSGYKGNKFAL